MSKSAKHVVATSGCSKPQVTTGTMLSHLPQSAFELLGAQPISLVGLTEAERERIVISAVMDEQGKELVVSRLGGASWDFTVESWTQNTPAAEKRLAWPASGKNALFDDVRAVLYVWWKRGRDGAARPVATTVVEVGSLAILLVEYLISKGLRSFSEVTALHVSDYIAELKKTLKPTSVVRRVYILSLVWYFHDEMIRPLLRHPFAGESMAFACGVIRGAGGWNGELPSGLTAKTPVIPPSVQAILFSHAEAHLSRAEETFSIRDKEGGVGSYFALISLRDAIAYLVMVTTGMRHSELAGIKSGCWRTEIRNGATFHWIRTVEHKTKKGPVDYLAPPEAIKALEILARYAEPFQERLRAEIHWLEAKLLPSDKGDEVLPSGMTHIEILQRLLVARNSVENLFLAEGKMQKDHTGSCRIDVLSAGIGPAMKRFALAAGVNWWLNTHQCRRTFAWTVANTRLGRNGLIFLKWQLKHTTMSMTQLYASNPNQDDSLYEEFYAEMAASQRDVLESWFEDDMPLSGGAGQRIVKARAIPVKDFVSLLELTAESITIRATGHSWCLSEAGRCVGEGIYEAIRCGTCSDAVIDSSHRESWQGIHLHNLELLKLRDCGPSILQRAKRDVKQSAQILNQLGVEVLPLPESQL